MKTEQNAIHEPEGRTIALLTGLSIGMGIVVHKIFFLVAAAIALIVPLRRLTLYVYELEKRELAHRQA